MCPKHCDQHNKRPTPMTIPRANGASIVLRSTRPDRAGSAASRKDRHQLLRWNHFELRVGAVARLLVGAPSSKLRHVTEASSLHMLICDLNHEFRSERFPGQILALTPAALAARHSTAGFATRFLLLR